MASNISKETREFFEEHIKKYPPLKDPDDTYFNVFDRKQTPEEAKAAWSLIMQRVLDGKIK